MAETWFRARIWALKVEPVEVVRETEKTVEIRDGRSTFRSHKSSQGEGIFPRWDEAHAFLLNQAELKLENARTALQRAQGAHGRVKGMKKPEPA